MPAPDIALRPSGNRAPPGIYSRRRTAPAPAMHSSEPTAATGSSIPETWHRRPRLAQSLPNCRAVARQRLRSHRRAALAPAWLRGYAHSAAKPRPAPLPARAGRQPSNRQSASGILSPRRNSASPSRLNRCVSSDPPASQGAPVPRVGEVPFRPHPLPGPAASYKTLREGQLPLLRADPQRHKRDPKSVQHQRAWVFDPLPERQSPPWIDPRPAEREPGLHEHPARR